MPGTRRRLSADVRREQILETATELFIQNGFENVKMSDIAERLQTSRPNIYTYYPSTEAILEVVLERHAKAYLDHLSRSVATGSAIPTIQNTFDIMMEHTDLFMLLSSGGGPTFRKHREIIDSAMDAYSMDFVSVSDDDPRYSQADAVISLMRNMLLGAVVQTVLYPERYDKDELVNLLTKMLQTGYEEALPDATERLERYLKRARQQA